MYRPIVFPLAIVSFITPPSAAAFLSRTDSGRSLLSNAAGICCDRQLQRRPPSRSAIPPGRVEDADEWVTLSSESLRKFTGRSLYDEMGCPSDRTTTAPGHVHDSERYAVLSHGTQDDPIYCYFNRAALLAFEFPEPEVYRLPSRYSAPDGTVRTERDSIIRSVAETRGDGDGDEVVVLEGAVRRKDSGELFQIERVLLWNVYDRDGNRVGQTAIFDRDKVVPVKHS